MNKCMWTLEGNIKCENLIKNNKIKYNNNNNIRYIESLYNNLSYDFKNDIQNIYKLCFPNKNMNLLNDTMIIICLFNDNIVGSICYIDNYSLIKNNIDTNGYNISMHKGSFIYNLCVHPDFRRMGFGNLLIKKLKDCIRKNGDKYVHTHVEENNLSLKLFKKNNFYEENQFINNDKKNRVITLFSWL